MAMASRSGFMSRSLSIITSSFTLSASPQIDDDPMTAVDIYKDAIPIPIFEGTAARLGIGMGLDDPLDGSVRHGASLQDSQRYLPTLVAFNENKEIIGNSQVNAISRVGSSGFIDISIPHQKRATDQKARYLQVIAGEEAVCIAFIFLSLDNSTQRGWMGDMGRVCGYDWGHSYVPTGPEAPRSACTWIAKDQRYGAAGLQLDLDVFTRQKGEFATSSSYYCNSSRMLLQREIIRPSEQHSALTADATSPCGSRPLFSYWHESKQITVPQLEPKSSSYFETFPSMPNKTLGYRVRNETSTKVELKSTDTRRDLSLHTSTRVQPTCVPRPSTFRRRRWQWKQQPQRRSHVHGDKISGEDGEDQGQIIPDDNAPDDDYMGPARSLFTPPASAPSVDPIVFPSPSRASRPMLSSPSFPDTSSTATSMPNEATHISAYPVHHPDSTVIYKVISTSAHKHPTHSAKKVCLNAQKLHPFTGYRKNPPYTNHKNHPSILSPNEGLFCDAENGVLYPICGCENDLADDEEGRYMDVQASIKKGVCFDEALVGMRRQRIVPGPEHGPSVVDQLAADRDREEKDRLERLKEAEEKKNGKKPKEDKGKGGLVYDHDLKDDGKEPNRNKYTMGDDGELKEKTPKDPLKWPIPVAFSEGNPDLGRLTTIWEVERWRGRIEVWHSGLWSDVDHTTGKRDCRSNH